MLRNGLIYSVLMTFLLFSNTLMAKDNKRKTEELPPFTGTYWIENFSSLKDAESKAVEEAIKEALVDRYGVFTDTKSTTSVTNVDGVGSTEYTNSGVSILRGELVKLIEAKDFKRNFVDNKLQITVTVRILAREKSNADIDISCLLLKNKDDRTENLKFIDNEDIYLAFRSPIDGYLAVYLEDENQMVYCLLPYTDSQQGSVYVKHDKKYLFFCDDKDYFDQHKNLVPPDDYAIVNNLYLTCSDNVIFNKIYVLFSPNPFIRANADLKNNKLAGLPASDFQKWLGKCRMDDDFVDMTKLVEISPK